MVASAKEDKVIYSNLVEPLLDMSMDSDDNNTVAIILSCISLAVSIILCLALIFMYRKYVKVLQAMLLSQCAPVASTYKLPSFHYTVKTAIQTTTAKSPIEHFHSHFKEFNEYLVIILAILTIIFIVVRKLRSNKRPQLYLEVSDNKNCSIIPVMFLPRCIQHCKLNGDTAQLTVSIDSFGVFSKLKVNWADVNIRVSNIDELLSLPSPIKLNPFATYSLYRVLQTKDKYTIQVWVAHHKFCIPIDAVQSSIPSAPMEEDNLETQPLYPKLP